VFQFGGGCGKLVVQFFRPGGQHSVFVQKMESGHRPGSQKHEHDRGSDEEVSEGFSGDSKGAPLAFLAGNDDMQSIVWHEPFPCLGFVWRHYCLVPMILILLQDVFHIPSLAMFCNMIQPRCNVLK